jgi:GT2 family glycosyltransferase
MLDLNMDTRTTQIFCTKNIFFSQNINAKEVNMNSYTKNLSSIIILCHENAKMLDVCIKSINSETSATKTPFEVIVVSNGLSGSNKGIVEEHLKNKTIQKAVFLEKNVGFPAGNNKGAEVAEGEYIVLLNDDTIVTDGWLEKMKKAMDGDANLAAVGPYTNNCAHRQRVQCPDFKDENDMLYFAEQFRGAESFEDDFIVFFCVMIRRTVWDKIGGLEEKFGMGNFEDNYFCFKARELGYRLKIVSHFIYHLGGQTNKKSAEERMAYSSLIARNQKLYYHLTNQYKTIALCMIVSDKENPDTFERCLKSVCMWVDFVYVVFNYQKNMNRKRWERLYKKLLVQENNFGIKAFCSYEEWTNFSDMRNLSFDMAYKTDYLFWLDTDDVLITPAYLRIAVNKRPDVDAFNCVVKSHKRDTDTYEIIRQYRLVRNDARYRFENLVHEDLTLSLNRYHATQVPIDIEVLHTGYDDPKIFAAKNERNLVFLEKEIKENPGTLAYYAAINSHIIRKYKNEKEKRKGLRIAIDLIHECFDHFEIKDNDPIKAKMFVLLGVCHLNREEEEEASDAFKIAVTKWGHPEGIVLYAEQLINRKLYKEAYDILFSLYEKPSFAMTNIPFDPVEIERLTLIKLGDASFELYRSNKEDNQGMLENAFKYYTELMSIMPGNIYCADRLMWILREKGNEQAAAYIAVKLINQNPEYVQGWQNLAVFEYKNNRYITAEIFYREALKRDPKNKEIRHNLMMLRNVNNKK